jgi:hypothetical protein
LPIIPNFFPNREIFKKPFRFYSLCFPQTFATSWVMGQDLWWKLFW